MEIGKVIDISEIPKIVKMRRSPFRELFKQIPEGKVLVISEKEANLGTVYSFLKHTQSRGEFRDYRCIRRTVDGERLAYVIHLDSGKEEKIE